jgi:hypothetical protein
MRVITILTVAVVSLALTGCYVQTLHPLYTDDKLTFDPGLAGSWLDPEDPGESMLIEIVDENAYRVTLTEEDGNIEYEGRLVQLGESVFLDLCPAEARRKRATDDFIPLHMLFWVQRDGDKLKVAGIDFEWLEKGIDADEIRVEHLVYDGRIILLGEAKELQRFFMSLADTQGALEDAGVLRRAK